MLELAAPAPPARTRTSSRPSTRRRLARRSAPVRWSPSSRAWCWRPTPTTARELARQHLATYLGLPNYSNNWKRIGFTDDDLADGGSDRLVDALVRVGRRVDDRGAGAGAPRRRCQPRVRAGGHRRPARLPARRVAGPRARPDLTLVAFGSIRHEIRIDRPADDVWALAGDPTRLHEWFPGHHGVPRRRDVARDHARHRACRCPRRSSSTTRCSDASSTGSRRRCSGTTAARST